MKALVFGSLNIDHTYNMDHFVRPGETESSISYNKNLGGKGFNQAIALGKAGAEVLMAGCIGEDGQVFLDELKRHHVEGQLVRQVEGVSGHAIIQVASGENCIILDAGANYKVTKDYVDEVISYMNPGDTLLLQNEINNIDYIIQKAKERSMKIYFNLAPMNEKIHTYPLDLVDVFIINETEACALVGIHTDDTEEIIAALEKNYYHKEILLTLGEKGSYYLFEGTRKYATCVESKVVDTTAAGDTYTGYFLAKMMKNKSIEDSMKNASFASHLTVEKAGASISIPTYEEVYDSFIRQQASLLPEFTGKDVDYKTNEFGKLMPLFDKPTKEYVYSFYKLGLLEEDYFKKFKKMGVKEIEDMSIEETITMLTFYMRQEREHTTLMAKAIENGKFRQLCDHLKNLIKEPPHD